MIRRALRFASQAGKNDPFLYRLIQNVNDSFGGHYKNIEKRCDYIAEIVKSEEAQFLKTVSSGLSLFNTLVDDIKAANKNQLSGKMAFKLYDTYGFPFDLTQVMAKEKNIELDESGFNKELDEQRKRSRDARQATLKDGVDDSIEALSSIVEPVHHGIYIDQPGGGEARIQPDDQQRFGLAQHHTRHPSIARRFKTSSW